jgi:1-acyl-sn-glycerol-3-phosphate acyltransferase
MLPASDKNSAFYWLIVALFRYYFSSYHSLRIEGSENMPKSGGALFVSNHTSFFDPPALACGSERSLDFLARKTLFNHPFFSKIIRDLNAIPVDQDNPDMAGLKNIIKRLRNGRVVVLFPEGARSYDGQLLPGQPGIGLVIEKAAVPVVPARFFGMNKAWPRGGSPTIFTPVTLVVGKPFIATSDKEDKRERFQDLSDQVMDAIAAIQPPPT